MVDEVAGNKEIPRYYSMFIIKTNRYSKFHPVSYAAIILYIMTYYRPVRGSNFVSHPGGRAPSSDITL